MDPLAYRMNNRVSDRLRAALKQQIMSLILQDGYFYLDREDFVRTFQELITELNKQEEVK